MKKLMLLFPVGIYSSKSDGAKRQYEVDEGKGDALGQADDLRLHIYTHRRDATVVATLRLYESSLDGPPDIKGKELSPPGGYVIGNDECQLEDVSGPFCGRLKAVLEVEDDNTTNPMSITLEIGATLFFE
jgi:hypothetical protein